ncbi:divalent metal cation transporter [Amycolatopsis sp. K13G38]|uniref:Divalent metal cation transporter n=1 Tax=Amycolatopsis acididurans TaxID=2724524 RepID=A0ABX1IX92_9PSEU|nr:divalent metal cation transporter [Amycolatopsis acididurans]NKQ52069.1 divalent metal cation transporter [Amycolatopsis acididurans]
MKGVLNLTLGVMTAIGGFVDIGNIVTGGVTGARFGMTLAWAVVLATAIMVLYGEMTGRVAAVAQRATFDLVRERLGVRFAMVNLVANLLLALLTLAAEIGGVALVLQLVTGVQYLIWVPVVGAVVWLSIWRLPFKVIETAFGLLGLCLLVFAVALVALPTDWGELWHEMIHPAVPQGEALPTWLFYAISLVGACIVPYQVIFFSSGGREERWSIRNLREARGNAFVGFPLGGLLSLSVMAVMVPVLRPDSVDVKHLGQVALPVAQALGVIGLILTFISFFACTFAAAAESALSCGYSVGQYLGWSWGKWHRPSSAPRFHVVSLAAVIIATGFVLTTIDPITVTIVSVVLGAAAVPLTYLPVLVVANDREYMGEYVNKHWQNGLATIALLVMLVVSVATLPLLFATKAGQ